MLRPSWSTTRWTWSRISLLVFAVFSLVDSLFVPMSRDVDPGRASEGILFLILTFRAASRMELPVSVPVAGGCLAALVAGRVARAENWETGGCPRFGFQTWVLQCLSSVHFSTSISTNTFPTRA